MFVLLLLNIKTDTLDSHSINNHIGVFEDVIDAEGNFTDKIWEWK